MKMICQHSSPNHVWQFTLWLDKLMMGWQSMYHMYIQLSNLANKKCRNLFFIVLVHLLLERENLINKETSALVFLCCYQSWVDCQMHFSHFNTLTPSAHSCDWARESRQKECMHRDRLSVQTHVPVEGQPAIQPVRCLLPLGSEERLCRRSVIHDKGHDITKPCFGAIPCWQLLLKWEMHGEIYWNQTMSMSYDFWWKNASRKWQIILQRVG